jgi:hypothetical protein
MVTFLLQRRSAIADFVLISRTGGHRPPVQQKQKSPLILTCQRAFDLIPLILDDRNAYRHVIAWCEW